MVLTLWLAIYVYVSYVLAKRCRVYAKDFAEARSLVTGKVVTYTAIPGQWKLWLPRPVITAVEVVEDGVTLVDGTDMALQDLSGILADVRILAMRESSSLANGDTMANAAFEVDSARPIIYAPMIMARPKNSDIAAAKKHSPREMTMSAPAAWRMTAAAAGVPIAKPPAILNTPSKSPMPCA